MKKIYLLFALVLLIHHLTIAQCTEITQLLSAGTVDRGSTVTGFVKEDNGDVVFIWEDNVGGNPWSNYDAKIYLTKIDQGGNVLWQHEFGGVGYDRAGNIYKTIDGGYVFAGSGRTLGPNWSDSYVFKTDENGVEQWSTILGGASYGQNDGRQLLLDDEGNILFYGLGQHHPGCSGYVFRVTQLSPDGEVNWSHCYNENEWQAVAPVYLEATSEYVFGITIDGGVRIIKKDLNGTTTFEQDYFPSALDGNGAGLRGKFTKGQNGHYLMLSGNPADCFPSALIEFNAQNEVEWEIIEPCLNTFPQNARVLNDGSWLVQFWDNDDAYFQRISADGEVLFSSSTIDGLFVNQFELLPNNEIVYSGRYGASDNSTAIIETFSCDELTGSAICDPCLTNYMAGDLNCDGAVGVEDLITMLSRFGDVVN